VEKPSVKATVSVARQAVERLREVLSAGRFENLAAVDKLTGEVADVEARNLFAALPTVTPATTPEELVEHGLIDRVPANLAQIYAQAKYRRGRPLFVRAHVNHAVKEKQRPVGEFSATGKLVFTHRATLRGQRGDSFLVEVDGADEPMLFARPDVFSWNEPWGVPSAGGTLSGVRVDYNDPVMKAHVCAGFLDAAEQLATLDFAAMGPDLSGRQAQIVHRLASRVRMSYPGRGEGYAGQRAGSLLLGGQGVCFVQRAVAVAFLQCFSRVLGFEIQAAVGKMLRLDVMHAFAVVMLRPSLKRLVCDVAWAEPLTDLRVAFFGPNWGQDRRLVGFEGAQELAIRPDDVDLAEVGAA